MIVCTALGVLSCLAASQSGGAGPVDLPLVKDLHVGGHISDWKGQGLPITVFSGEGELLPSNRFSAKAKLGWSDEGLLAQVEVTAPDGIESADSDRPYEGESVEFVARIPGTDQDLLQLVLSPGISEDHPAASVKAFDYRNVARRARVKPTFSFFREKTPNGYVADFLIPWSNLEATPKEGAVFAVRLSINHLEADHSRVTLAWHGNQELADFWNPPLVRLADKPGSLPLAAAWGYYSDLMTTHACAITDLSLVGQTAEFSAGPKSAAPATVVKDGDRGVASVSFPAPALGEANARLKVTIGTFTASPELPDITAERRNAFIRAGTKRFGYGPEDRLTPRFEPAVFTSPNLPELQYLDFAYVERIVGPIQIHTRYFDKDLNEVTRAKTPGRYVALAQVVARSGPTFTTYRTLFRTPDGKAPDTTDPMAAAAAYEGKTGIGAAMQADDEFVHRLRKRLGTAIKYEYYVKTPTDYDPNGSKKWPLIIYLHGSGGGEANVWDHVKVSDGPQSLAHSKDKFPFIVVSLRSHGGWFPPAVHDVIDEVEQGFRIDKNREYLTGFSMGGMGTYVVAYSRPDRFAAMAPVAGAGGVAQWMPLLSHLPAWVFNGEDDTTTPATLARRAVELLRQSGDEVKFTGYPDKGHVETLQLAYAEPELYTWFLAHQRSAAK